MPLIYGHLLVLSSQSNRGICIQNMLHTCSFFFNLSARNQVKNGILNLKMNLNCLCTYAVPIFAVGRYAMPQQPGIVIKNYLLCVYMYVCIYRELCIEINIQWKNYLSKYDRTSNIQYQCKVQYSPFKKNFTVFTLGNILADTIRCIEMYLSVFHQLLQSSVCI